MSVRASSWVWESSKARGSAFLVLLALADHAGADGGDAFPSVHRLSVRCRVDERTVQRALASLLELGEIVVQDHATSKKPNRYRLTLRGDNLSPQTSNGGDIVSSGGGNLSAQGWQDAALTKSEASITAPTDSPTASSALVKDRSCTRCEGTHVVETDAGFVQCECVRAA